MFKLHSYEFGGEYLRSEGLETVKLIVKVKRISFFGFDIEKKVDNSKEIWINQKLNANKSLKECDESSSAGDRFLLYLRRGDQDCKILQLLSNLL